MSSFTDVLNEKIVNHFLRSVTETVGGSLNLGLFSSDPLGANGLSNEISYTGYLRQIVIFSAYDASTNTIENVGNLIFPKYTGVSSVECTHCGVFDGSTLILSGEIEIPATLYPNEVIIWPIGELELVIA